MSVLSIDLASKRYSDNGIVLLERDRRQPELIHPDALDLHGTPRVAEFASALARFAHERDVRIILLDGPQGWRSQASPIQHMRLCERAVNTPGKTGTVGNVKPSTYLGYIQFTIDLFASLTKHHGYHLLHSGWEQASNQLWLAESFPTAAWKTLGLKPLPAKSKTTREKLRRSRDDLSRVSGLEIQQDIHHDQLQALVASLAGLAVVHRAPAKLLLLGVDPWIDQNGEVLEGLIALPRLDGGIPFLPH